MTFDSYSRRSVLKQTVVTTGALALGSGALAGSAAAGRGNGRVGQYQLNNPNPGGRVHDSSPYRNDGMNHGATIVEGAGHTGNAFEFDGVDDLVAVPNAESLNAGTGPLSVAGWVNLDADTGNYSMVAVKRKPSANWVGWELDTGSDGAARFLVDDGSGSSGRAIAVSNTALTADHWQHVAGVWDAENDEARVYVDGEPTGSADTSNVGDTDTTAAMGIGGRPSDNRYYLDGLLDEIRVYDRMLSDREVRSLAGKPDRGRGN